MARQSDYPWFNEKKWLAVRPVVFDRDGYACTVCGDTGDDPNNRLTVDHTKPLMLFTQQDIESDLAYDPDHLTTMCNRCNGTKKHRVLVRNSGRNIRFYQKS